MAHDYGSPKGQRQLMAKSAVERRDSEAQMPHVRLTDCTSLSLSHVVSFGDGFRCMIVKRTPHLPNESATFVTEYCGRDGVSAISKAQTPHTTRLTDVV